MKNGQANKQNPKDNHREVLGVKKIAKQRAVVEKDRVGTADNFNLVWGEVKIALTKSEAIWIISFSTPGSLLGMQIPMLHPKLLD